MGRRSRKSKRRLNSLKLSVLLTAILLIASTYAWFSSNRQVSIEDITARVVAAEGLQISLDGSEWGASVSVTDTTLATAAAKGTNANVYTWPTALEPVSATGTELTSGAINFYYGLIDATGTELTSIASAPPNLNKFISFDVYLKNSSSQQAGDDLTLASGSKLIINHDNGVANTGLESSARVGFVLYQNTADFTAPLNTAQGSSIVGVRDLAPGTPKVSIWEPNYNYHTAEVIANDTRISAETTDWTTLALLSGATGTHDDTNDTSKLVLKPANTDTARTGILEAQNTVKTAVTPVDTNGASNGISAAEDLTTVASTQASPEKLVLQPNKIMKMKVYIWLEGQDPDCIDTASTGKQFDVLINLAKPAPQQQGGGSGGGSGTGG